MCLRTGSDMADLNSAKPDTAIALYDYFAITLRLLCDYFEKPAIIRLHVLFVYRVSWLTSTVLSQTRRLLCTISLKSQQSSGYMCCLCTGSHGWSQQCRARRGGGAARMCSQPNRRGSYARSVEVRCAAEMWGVGREMWDVRREMWGVGRDVRCVAEMWDVGCGGDVVCVWRSYARSVEVRCAAEMWGVGREMWGVGREMWDVRRRCGMWGAAEMWCVWRFYARSVEVKCAA
jgi:hypothetical protein